MPIITASRNITLVKYPGVKNDNLLAPGQRLKVLFLTSLRDVALIDRNGEYVETADGTDYMEGAIEWITREIKNNERVREILQIVGVVYDDLEKDLGDRYPLSPQAGRPWIYDQRSGLWNSTFHIPSRFRALPLGDSDGRAELKQEFEEAVLRIAQELGADVIVSDHYMARIDFLFPPVLELGRVLNIHPAITLKGHPFCFRGPTPTADAIAEAGKRTVRTGATLHIINPIIDDGPVLAYSDCTPVYSQDQPEELRLRNYKRAKLPVLLHGLIYYATRIFPVLREVDFSDPV